MEDTHREPWEALTLTVAGYLSLLLWHCTITAIDYAVIIMKYREEFNLGECIEIPSLLL